MKWHGKLKTYLLLVNLGTWLAGCAGDDCDADTERACIALSGCRGTSRCSGSPTEWQACICDDQESAGPQDPEAPALKSSQAGATCETTEECASGELCLSSSGDQLLGGGLAHGVCAADCTEDPQACDQFDADLICVQTLGQATEEADDDLAFCFLACTLGDGRENKCQSRADLVCDNSFLQTEDNAAFCRPLCTTDDDCDPGYCDLGTGACAAKRRHGNAFGDQCDAELGCDGLCVSAETEESPDFEFCGHRCSIGVSDVCARDAAGHATGYCHLLGNPDNAVHDTGFCEPLCDCTADCIHPGAVCSFSPEVEAATGRSGTCTAPGASPVVLDVCPTRTDAGTNDDAGTSDAGTNSRLDAGPSSQSDSDASLPKQRTDAGSDGGLD